VSANESVRRPSASAVSARIRWRCASTFLTDIPDTWKREGENQEYFDRFSPDGYAVGVNIILYAMTH